MNINTILALLKHFDELTEQYVTQVEITPIHIKDDLYLCGIERHNINQFQVHLKTIRQLPQTSKKVIEGELYLDLELTKIEDAINKFITNATQLEHFLITTLKYKLKTENSSDYIIKEESIIYDDRRQACQDILEKRKKYIAFTSHIITFDKNKPNNNKTNNKPSYYKLTDEQFAEISLQDCQ